VPGPPARIAHLWKHKETYRHLEGRRGGPCQGRRPRAEANRGVSTGPGSLGINAAVGSVTTRELLGLHWVSVSDGLAMGHASRNIEGPNPLSDIRNPEREGFEPSIPLDAVYRISRKRTEPDWPRLEPSPEYAPAHRTDSTRLAPTPNWHRRWHHPRARMDAAPPHRLPERAVTSPIAREARRSPCGSSRVAAEHRSGAQGRRTRFRTSPQLGRRTPVAIAERVLRRDINVVQLCDRTSPAIT
jgi:hypothetical protein